MCACAWPSAYVYSYQEEIEAALLEALPPEEIEALMEKLPAYMEKV